jgi:phospholipid/cholesterol/gamma-HCH transport system substrate-binding protein
MNEPPVHASRNRWIFIILSVGVLSVCAALIFWRGFFFPGKYYTVFAVLERADGLSANSPVEMNGLVIGKIKELTLHPDNSGRILVQLLIDDSISIPENSSPKLQRNETGDGIVLALIPRKSSKPLRFFDTLVAGTPAVDIDSLMTMTSKVEKFVRDTIKPIDSILKKVTPVKPSGDTIYKIQVLSASNKKVLEKPEINCLPEVGTYEMNGTINVTSGNYASFREAVRMKDELRKKGFSGAFVVGFVAGKRVKLK